MATALLKLTDVQLGVSGTATNNFTIYQPATPDGTLRIGNGNSGSATDRVTITSAGNVGIGTTSPVNPFVVSNSGGIGFEVNVGGGTYASLNGYNRSGAAWAPMSYSASYHVFNYAGTSEAMRIDTSGNVGVGTTTSLSRLTALGTTSVVANGASTRNPVASIRGGNDNNRLELYVDNSGATAIMGLGAYNSAGGATAMTFYTGATATERMRIDSSGNVGIGTSAGITTVSSGLAINNATAGNYPGFEIQTAGVTRFYINANNAASYITSVSTNPMVFSTNGSEAMRIDSSGNLLVGCTAVPNVGATPQQFGTSSSSTEVVISKNTNGPALYIKNVGGGNGIAAVFYNGVLNAGNITTTTSATTSYNTSSDYRLKENIQPMQNALGVVAQLNPVTYNWKADGSDGQGFIAHELQAVVPDCVTGEKDAVDEDGNPKYQGIDTSFLVATLTKAIQELNEKLNQQAAEIATLKGAA